MSVPIPEIELLISIIELECPVSVRPFANKLAECIPICTCAAYISPFKASN